MAILSELEPKDFFKYFEEVSSIPRPSYHEQAISNYLVDFAKTHNLEYYQDDLHNVIIIKEASKEYEDIEPIILQGHMDMVCEQDNEYDIDMTKQGLNLYIDGDYIKAKGTTLGADDGIAIAYALSFLADDKLKSPRIEFVCTVCEEMGLEGANAIDLSMLKGRRLINIDSFEEGILTAGCAGGGRLCLNKKLPSSSNNSDLITYNIEISGCVGGHSGSKIHLYRANAICLLARVLLSISNNMDFKLLQFSGGSKDNAIPLGAACKIAISPDDTDSLLSLVDRLSKDITEEYKNTDPMISISCASDMNESSYDIAYNPLPLIGLINTLPNGVIKMRGGDNPFVETSLNLGIASLEDGTLNLVYCLRSNIESGYDAMVEKCLFIAKEYSFDAVIKGEYPGWAYKEASPLRDGIEKAYSSLYGKPMTTEVIHAGLECGILGAKLGDIDAVSLGPDAPDIHTPAERLSISSAARMYNLLKQVIESR